MNLNSIVEFSGQRRLHVGLSVVDVDRSRGFYETLLGVPPVKERAGYIKFEPTDPSVNLTLHRTSPQRIGDRGASGASHFGIQVKSTDAVREAIDRLTSAGIEIIVEENTTCCYAVQDKVWATDPDGNRWEVFVVLETDAPTQTSTENDCRDEQSDDPCHNHCGPSNATSGDCC